MTQNDRARDLIRKHGLSSDEVARIVAINRMLLYTFDLEYRARVRWGLLGRFLRLVFGGRATFYRHAARGLRAIVRQARVDIRQERARVYTVSQHAEPQKPHYRTTTAIQQVQDERAETE